ncbi:transcriptional regulator [Enterococcus ureilyticus]|uniref:Transcriptional regulator n=1 Tax=Enterococcus ureilyticus TaxID=1131292 RepID=A0A1E5HC81_9ENTE|nr:helix-turn-helix transcriptional regulator [Enterococcus ureilyticus]MBM7690419.1 putative transcriptional regulator [Enterococcus ureilyticus]OEG22513.1 transcriptional regulator [Enterococcus ureilyticus]
MANHTIIDTTIHVYRAKKRMTQKELADRVGVSKITIINLERLKSIPSLLLVYDVAKVFEVSIEDLFIFEQR